MDAILDQTVNIFRYLSDKDTFEKYYKTHLSKRLVQGKSVSDDAEHGMLAKLKVECGIQFTRKMEGMFSDIKVSQDMTHQYQTYVSNLETVSFAFELKAEGVLKFVLATANTDERHCYDLQLLAVK